MKPRGCGAFCIERGSMKKGTIYCPDCARVLYVIGNKQTMGVNVKCGCGRYYRINPLYMKATEIKKPERMTSSGDTFY